jgi:hypothetical protein
MTAALFLGFFAATVIAVVALIVTYVPRAYASGIVIGLALWLAYGGALGYLGLLRDPSLRPPGIFYLLFPVFIFVPAILVRSPGALRVALAIPLGLLMAVQSYRIGVELLLNQLWMDGLVPRMLTFEGANVDIYIGTTAPLAAWLSGKGRRGLRLALVWNILGLLALANIATRSLLTAPGPLNILHTEVPNLAMGTFPYSFIPGYFAPMAVMIHVLAIRAIRAKLRADRPLDVLVTS